MTRKFERASRAAMGGEGGFEALQSMLKGEYTEESTGARTIRQSGGKDRHSKVFTARGPRDRRVRLSVATAIRFYDLQDRLGFEQPSKAVEWLLLHCQPSIQALPQLASLHPMRIMSVPQPTHMADHPHNHRKQDPGHDDHNKLHQKETKCYVDTTVHQNRKVNFNGFNFTTSQLPSLHDGPLPVCISGNQVQNSIEEDPPQSSNPSSSGASSDHPTCYSDIARSHCTGGSLPEAKPMIMAHPTAASATGIRQCSASFTPPSDSHTNKRHRIQHQFQNQFDGAMFGSHSTSAGTLSLCAGRPVGITNGLSSSVKYSSLCNLTNFNDLMINEENSALASNSRHPQRNGDLVQPIMRIPSIANHSSNQYVDIAQLFSTPQASQLALNDPSQLIQSACNQSKMREGADVRGQAYTIDNNTGNINQLYNYNQIALQQVDELVCSNSMYASPSPSESTSINTLAAAYSKTACNHMQVDDHAVNTLYRPSWNSPASGQLQ